MHKVAPFWLHPLLPAGVQRRPKGGKNPCAKLGRVAGALAEADSSASPRNDKKVAGSEDDERKTSNGKNNDKSRFLAALGMTKKSQVPRMTNGRQATARTTTKADSSLRLGMTKKLRVLRMTHLKQTKQRRRHDFTSYQFVSCQLSVRGARQELTEHSEAEAGAEFHAAAGVGGVGLAEER
jgi:hypothetical protein